LRIKQQRSNFKYKRKFTIQEILKRPTRNNQQIYVSSEVLMNRTNILDESNVDKQYAGGAVISSLIRQVKYIDVLGAW